MDFCLLLEIWIINYGQKLFDSAKKSAVDAVKTTSKRAIQKTAEATGDLIGNKIADKITNASKKSNNNNNDDDDEKLTTYKKYIYLQKKENKSLMN